METVKIPARALAEYVYKSGSLESGFKTAASMTEGTKAHQHIQTQYKEGDQKEVPLSLVVQVEGINFLLEGRCDGLLQEDSITVIDEIKSTSGSLDHIEADSYPVHWAQAKCYAYMTAVKNDLEFINVRLTYVQRDTYLKKHFTLSFSKLELEENVLRMLEVYAPFAKMKLHQKRLRTESAKSLEFPFTSFRPGQKLLAGSVFRSIREGDGNLYVNAPTGIGKTISTLYPAIKAIGEEYIEHIFYITARTTTRKAAEEAISLMIQDGLHVSSVTLTAKEKICFKEQGCCPGEGCLYAEGYYDRINEAILDIKENEKLMKREVIEEYARKHRLCPFEFSLDLAYLSDIIICDYNYIYDPRISLKRLVDEKKKKSVLLVDEAHNLPDRAREMFSASLSKKTFLQLKRTYQKTNPVLSKAASLVNKFFIDAKKMAIGNQEILFGEIPETLTEVIKGFSEQAENEILSNVQNADELLEAYYASQNFLKAASLFNKCFKLYGHFEKGDMIVKIFCLDPSEFVKKAGKGYRTKVFFSATLVPKDYFMEMLGSEDEDRFVSIPSPFHKEQIDMFISPLSTRYRDRESSYSLIAETIQLLVKERPGNFFCFFPSYLFMEKVHSLFCEEEGVTVMMQTSQMSEEERDSFLSHFKARSKRSLVGFAVMGGIFSEGVDLPGDRLTGVIITGVGLPQISFERDLLKGYYSAAGRPGYDYAYTFPGMNKVLQAGGRLIRSEEDCGTILLIDDRFLQNKYLALFPEEWREFTII
ncbi:ATP-dependent DNA helicase [Neobacillus notoginsengisoli]|uniref:ATP-dependent DNA helicase n=1 Tax=Neobacillus notoginsengisoli TaxID=1578198 RepID=A0A417YXF3_9BACI|nr:ATP-dependent DNA helicase [Neobacillus notoginsengisoli]RHW42082.1 ATP-dependent DNA helicase [Neobacillus notoginsengisoli]